MWYRRIGKRVFDAGLFGLLLLPAAVLSVSIVLISAFVFGQRIFFLQKRLGYKNKVFTIYKFATLLPVSSQEKDSSSHKSRETGWGKFLRDYSLDELPQLLNILKGDMSFIGPRPLLPEYMSVYTREEAKRHEVKPGLSGLAQVSGRNELSWAEKMAFDRYYVAHLSFSLDLNILFKTLRVISKGQEVNHGTAPKEEPLKLIKI